VLKAVLKEAMCGN